MGEFDHAPDFVVLTRAEIARLLTFSDYVDAVTEAFRLYANGRAIAPGLLHVEAAEGEFHIKAGGFGGQGGHLAVKINGGFFQNPARHGLPAIQGVIVLSDASTGRPLACLESGGITVNRTGALTAVAVTHLARATIRAVTIIGCGRQARAQWRGIKHARTVPALFLVDSNPDAATAFAAEVAHDVAVTTVPFTSLRTATLGSDIIVSCTPSRQPFLGPDDVIPGALVVAVGADSPDKQELDPSLLNRGRVVVDILGQCAAVGELHHAIAARVLTPDAVYAEIGEILVGRKAGRRTQDETFIFDTTGTALQDAAAASLAYARALHLGAGARVSLL